MELLTVNAEQIEEIYKTYNTSSTRIQEDVKLLKEWIRKQPHLPQELQFDRALERILSISKYNVEKAKIKFDKFVALKNLNLEFFTDFGTDKYVKPCENSVILVPLPKLGPKNERITVFALKSPNVHPCYFQHLCQITVATLELCARYDYTNAVRFVADGNFFSFEHIKMMELNKLLRIANLSLNGYGAKLFGFHIINAKPATQALFKILKNIIKHDTIQKVTFHEDLNSLHDTIPQKYLPEEFGGSIGKLSSFVDKWEVLIEEHRYYIADAVKYTGDPSLRPNKDDYENDMFGLDGTFRNIDLD